MENSFFKSGRHGVSSSLRCDCMHGGLVALPLEEEKARTV